MLLEIIIKTEALREHIARRNLSQNGFAIKAEVSSGYLAQLLAGKKRPSGCMREKLMSATGLEFDILFRIVGRGNDEALEGEYVSQSSAH